MMLCLVIPYGLAEETVEWVFDTERFVLTQESLSITLSRDGGPWVVNDCQDEHSGLYAYLFDDLAIVNWNPFTAMDKASLYLGPIDRSAATVDPQSIRQWREAVGVSEESLGRAAQLDCIAGAEAQQNGLRCRGFVKTQTLE